MLSRVLTPHQLAALRAGLTRPLVGPNAEEQLPAFQEACNRVLDHLQALNNGVGLEEAQLALLRWASKPGIRHTLPA